MKRRGFLGALLSAPAVAVGAKEPKVVEKEVIKEVVKVELRDLPPFNPVSAFKEALRSETPNELALGNACRALRELNEVKNGKS